eukprot:406225-Amphidinium_carterae.1
MAAKSLPGTIVWATSGKNFVEAWAGRCVLDARGGGIQVNLIEAVVAPSGDPDSGLAEWFRLGPGVGPASIGIVNNMDTNSVFQAVPDGRTCTAEDIPVFHGEVGEWTNYRSAEDPPHVVQQLLRGMAAQGWAVERDSIADMERKLETPIWQGCS